MEIPVVQASSKSVQYRAQTPPRLPMVAALRDCKDCHRAVKGGIRKHSVSTKPGCKAKPVPPAPHMCNGLRRLYVTRLLAFQKLLRYLGYERCHIKLNLSPHSSSNLPHKYFLNWWGTFNYRNQTYVFTYIHTKNFCYCTLFLPWIWWIY